MNTEPPLSPPLLDDAWERVPPPIRQRCAGPPGSVAFDADGTLWRGDVSEDFTQWMVQRGHFEAGRWEAYRATEEVDPAAGAIEILQFYAGMGHQEIATHVERFWAEGPPRRWIPETVVALRQLAAAGFEVSVVSATPTMVLEPLPRLLPLRNLLGLEMECVEGTFTGLPTGIPTVGAGKVQRLGEVDGTKPCIAAGNSPPDLELLGCADLAWLIGDDPAMILRTREESWCHTSLETTTEDPAP